MNNYEFCAEFAARSGAATALDFGCGAGEVVSLMREGHCGVPFVQHFPANRVRTVYAYAMCCLGLSDFKGGKTRWQWAANACEWLDKWTYYRSFAEIAAVFERHLGPIKHVEAEWLDARLERRIPLPKRVKRAFVHRMAGLVIVCSRVAPKQSTAA